MGAICCKNGGSQYVRQSDRANTSLYRGSGPESESTKGSETELIGSQNDTIRYQDVTQPSIPEAIQQADRSLRETLGRRLLSRCSRRRQAPQSVDEEEGVDQWTPKKRISRPSSASTDDDDTDNPYAATYTPLVDNGSSRNASRRKKRRASAGVQTNQRETAEAASGDFPLDPKSLAKDVPKSHED